MNRRIKFRGKRTDNGTWEFGDLIHTKGILVTDTPPFLSDKVCINDREVYPDTVGQFTCLYDRNGKEIYEGDVVFILSTGRKCLVLYRDKAASFVLYGNGKISLNEAYWFETDVENSEVEIIGNIHDNPELLTAK
jgi:uncharacterized phage protein (TIGR01671 family)